VNGETMHIAAAIATRCPIHPPFTIGNVKPQVGGAHWQ
jgi:hypothetical protein